MACKYYKPDGACEMSSRCYFVVWIQPDTEKASYSTRQYRTLGSAIGPPDKCPVQGQANTEHSECSMFIEGN